jgi:hypothetical protein
MTVIGVITSRGAELLRSGEVRSYEHELEHLTRLMVHAQL